MRWFAALMLFVGLATLAVCRFPNGEYGAWRDDEPWPFIAGPYVLTGGTGEAFVLVRTRTSAAPRVEWWTEDAEPKMQTAKRRSGVWVATLQDLPAGKEIFYRVHSTAGSSKQSRFRSGPAEPQRFRFAAFGDTRTDHRVHRAVVEAIARQDIDFVVHTGDMLAHGGVRAHWDRFFQIERPLLSRTSIVPAVGNHDLGTRNYYQEYFQNDLWAKGRRYFVKDWGNLRIVGLDIGVEQRDGSDQYAFAEQALREGAEQEMLMVVVLHFPPFSSGKHGSHPTAQRTIAPLAEKYGVELVIAGHDHNYERTVPIEGTTYVVSGSAGAPIRPVRPKWFTAAARTEPHFVLVDTWEEGIVLRAINLQGDTFDTTVIEDNPPRS